MSYDILKNTIAEAIRPNGKQEITGQILQDVLLSIVNELGETTTQLAERVAEKDGTYPKMTVGFAQEIVGGVTLSQLAFAKSVNLFNENATDYQSGYALNSLGGTTANSAYNTSGFIKINPNTVYSFRAMQSVIKAEPFRFVAFYDSDKNMIGSLLSQSSQATSPADAAYMRATVHRIYFNYQIAEGAVLPEYTPYQPKIPLSAIMPAEKVGGNKIAIPKHIYILKGVRNDIFHDTYLKLWNPYKWSSEVRGVTNVVRKLERVISVDDAIDNNPIRFNVWNAETDEVEDTAVTTTRVGIPFIGSSPVTISIIGDSYTNGDFFVKALLENNYVPQLSMLGLRRVNEQYPTQHDEGRGGWTLAKYFRPTDELNDVSDGFNPFWQPEGAFRCWGSTRFWLNAIGCANGTYGVSNLRWYQCSMYDDYIGLFDNATGYLSNPTTNDIMYDSDNSRYVKWNGSAWVATNYADYTWSFDYAKYLAMWNIPSPSMLFVYLGVNDFWTNQPTEDSIADWVEKANIVANSYLATNAAGKFVLMLPNTVTMRNANGYESLKVHRNMWSARKAMIDNFDGRESNNIYVLDASLAIDSEHSYTISTDPSIIQPFDGYVGNEHIVATTDGVHPRMSYETLGYCLAAFIQKWR